MKKSFILVTLLVGSVLASYALFGRNRTKVLAEEDVKKLEKKLEKLESKQGNLEAKLNDLSNRQVGGTEKLGGQIAHTRYLLSRVQRDIAEIENQLDRDSEKR